MHVAGAFGQLTQVVRMGQAGNYASAFSSLLMTFAALVRLATVAADTVASRGQDERPSMPIERTPVLRRLRLESQEPLTYGGLKWWQWVLLIFTLLFFAAACLCLWMTAIGCLGADCAWWKAEKNLKQRREGKDGHKHKDKHHSRGAATEDGHETDTLLSDSDAESTKNSGCCGSQGRSKEREHDKHEDHRKDHHQHHHYHSQHETQEPPLYYARSSSPHLEKKSKKDKKERKDERRERKEKKSKKDRKDKISPYSSVYSHHGSPYLNEPPQDGTYNMYADMYYNSGNFMYPPRDTPKDPQVPLPQFSNLAPARARSSSPSAHGSLKAPLVHPSHAIPADGGPRVLETVVHEPVRGTQLPAGFGSQHPGSFMSSLASSAFVPAPGEPWQQSLADASAPRLVGEVVHEAVVPERLGEVVGPSGLYLQSMAQRTDYSQSAVVKSDFFAQTRQARSLVNQSMANPFRSIQPQPFRSSYDARDPKMVIL
jgi:hypothetical protein